VVDHTDSGPTASTAALAPHDPSDALRVVVSTESGIFTHALPQTGAITVGRSRRADLRVEEPSVSGLHARIHVRGKGAALEDLGSSNGTRMRGEPLVAEQLYPLLPGEVVDLGDAMLILQRGVNAGSQRGLCPPSAFESGLVAECERAAACGTVLTVIQARVAPGGSASTVEEALRTALGPRDLLAARSLCEYSALLFDTPRQDAKALAARLVALGAAASSATFPDDGVTATDLLDRSRPTDPAPALAEVPEGVLVRNPAMVHIYRLVSRVAPSEISVLIMGETGVGKEILAEAVHRGSLRAKGRFLRLNCGAFVDTLLESELFGHVAGAFTGAVKDKPGLFEAAQGGTVFLDEVGELPPSVQVKLLRVLEERSVRRVGGIETTSIDVRIVAATNRNLDVEIAEGRFREDLYYRLNGIGLYIPPLRERPDEIEPLARMLGERAKGQPVELDGAALEHLTAQPWPGNVRELKNTMERAVVLSMGEPIAVSHLMAPGRPVSRPNVPVVVEAEVQEPTPSLDADLRRLERQRIVEALERNGGNQTRAAKELGISRKKLIGRLESYGIPRPRKR